MKIVSCSNSLNFVKDLSNFPKEDLLKSKVLRFKDGETLVKIDDVEALHNDDVLVIQSIANNVNDALIELLFTLDLVYNVAPRSIYLLITYLGYSRQDKILDLNESFSLKIISNLLSQKHISRIFIIDIHSPQTIGFFNIPSMNISVKDVIINDIKKRFDIKDIILVSPDIGNAKNVIDMSSKIGVDYVVGVKHKSEVDKSIILNLNGCNVIGKTCIICDDIIDSAKTICNTANILKQQGAKSIYVFATHGVLSDESFDIINISPLNKIFIMNTIDFNEKLVYSSKIETISISDWCLDILSKYVK